MPDFTWRLRRMLKLPGGESIEQVAVVQPTGSSPRDAVGGQGCGPDARLPSTYGFLIVTDRRFLWRSYTGRSSVGDIEAELANDEVASADLGAGGVSSKLLTLAFTDGSEIGLVIADNQKPERLVTAMQSKLG